MRAELFFTVLTGIFLFALPSRAQSNRPSGPSLTWPTPIPGLAARVNDPADGRDWSLINRIDGGTITVVATAPGGVLAVTLRRSRQGQSTCETLISQLLHTNSLESYRSTSPAVFIGAPWNGSVYRQNSPTHDGEFGCLEVGTDIWIASAIAQPRAGVALTDAASMAHELSRALLDSSARRDYPLLLEASGLEPNDPGDGVAWVFLGRAQGFPVTSDTIASSSGRTGTVTLTVARREGTCAAAWTALRSGLSSDGAMVDRPGYVPEVFGARIRRLTADEHFREVYCVGSTHGALLITAMFRNDDSDAMTRMGPMLRALVSAAERAEARTNPSPSRDGGTSPRP